MSIYRLLIIPTYCAVNFFMCSLFSHARDRIHGIGSPITFSYVAKITEHLKYTQGLPAPFIEIGMTGFAFQFFCTGISDNYPDFINSSREMSPKEHELCKINKVDFTRLILTYDNLVLVTKEKSYLENISSTDLFNAISGYIFDKKGNLKVNRNKTWQDVNLTLPAKKITFYGTTLTSGTYDFLKEKIFTPHCLQAKKTDPLYDKCGLVRMDGKYVPVPGGYTMNIQKMDIRKNSIALIPYQFYQSYSNKIYLIRLNNLLPNENNNNNYTLSRPLYIYIKTNSLNTVPNFNILVKELKAYSIKNGKR